MHLGNVEVDGLQVTHFSDPGCPWAYSASPAHAVLRWRYGDQLRVAARHHRAHRAGRPVRPPRLHAGRLGARLRALPPPRHAVRDPAARARHRDRPGLPRDRRDAPAGARSSSYARLPRAAVRLVHDAAGARRPRRPREALARVDGLDVAAIVAALGDPEVEAAYQADRAEARTAEGSPTEAQGKAAADRRPGPLHGAVADLRRRGRRLEAGGFQPVEAYDVCSPTSTRRSSARRRPRIRSRRSQALPYGARDLRGRGDHGPRQRARPTPRRRGRADRPRRRRQRHPRAARGRRAVARPPSGAQRKRSGANGVRSSAGRSPLSAAASSSPLIGPRPTPAPSWPVATHRPASPARARARAARRAATAAGRPRRPRARSPATPGISAAARSSSARVTAGSTVVSNPRARGSSRRARRRPTSSRSRSRPAARPRAPRPRRGSRCRRPCGGSSSRAAQPRELALARLEREVEAGAARELRAPRPGGEHDRVRAQRPVGRLHALARHDPLHPRAGPHRDAGLLGHGAGDRARVALEVVGEPGGAEQVRPSAGSSARACSGSSSSQSHAGRGAAARAAPARPQAPPRCGGRPARPCGGSARARRSAARSRRRRRSPSTARSSSGPASLSEHSTLPSPSPVVPPETSPASSSSTSTPRAASARAVAAPTIPAPTTITLIREPCRS